MKGRVTVVLRLVAGFGLQGVMMAPAMTATIAVDVEGVAPGRGPVRVTICTGGLDEASCGTGQVVPSAALAVRAIFPDLPSGVYAVAAFQDIDESGRLERTALGLPTKPYGFSNGAGRRSRPDFRAAAFILNEPGTVVRVRLQPGVGGRATEGR